MANNMEDLVPIFASLVEVYGEGLSLEKASWRYENLKQQFEALYGREPELYARAPGRVNLNGEHIDYEGYYVLPMNIYEHTVIAIGKREQRAPMSNITNINSVEFQACKLSTNPFQEVDKGNHRWANYFICGSKSQRQGESKSRCKDNRWLRWLQRLRKSRSNKDERVERKKKVVLPREEEKVAQKLADVEDDDDDDDMVIETRWHQVRTKFLQQLWEDEAALEELGKEDEDKDSKDEEAHLKLASS